MKKRFFAIVLSLFMCLSVLTGCSLVETNLEKLYESVVCTITYSDGEVDEITVRELYTAYNSYGYYYDSYYGYTTEEAFLTTLDTIVDRKLTVKAVKDYYEAEGEELLIDSETTYLYDETYDSIFSNLKEYFEEIAGTSTSDDSDDSSTSLYETYEKSAYLDEVKTSDGSTKLIIKKYTTATTIRDTYKARYENGDAYDLEDEYFLNYLYQKIYSFTEGSSTSAILWRRALNEYIKDVKSNYSYMTFDSDEECFLFEINRVYEVLKENYLVEKYETIFNARAQQGDNYSLVTVNDVLEYYSAKVLADYTNYVINGNTSDYEDSILSDVGSVDYILEGDDATNYFYVAYIKLAFTDEQQEEYDYLTGDAYYGNETQQREALESLYQNVLATVRDEYGNETGTMTSQALLEKIANAVGSYKYTDEISISDLSDEEIDEILTSYGASAGITESEKNAILQAYVDERNEEIASENKNKSYLKAQAFKTYLYQYNDDDSLQNADYNTVIGVTADGEVLSSDFTDMEEIEEALKALYNDGNAKVGDMTDFICGEDGLYLFFFAGNIQNLFANINTIASNEENIKVLASTRLNIFSEKTLFDLLYDELTTDNFSVFQNMNMQYLRSQCQSIVANENVLKKLY